MGIAALSTTSRVDGWRVLRFLRESSRILRFAFTFRSVQFRCGLAEPYDQRGMLLAASSV
jgi:hypothetical protein